MKIRRMRLENFRAFDDQQFTIDNYACFVGANGAGKSTILAALNVFFREQPAPGIDPLKLARDDFHNGDPSKPIRITLHFAELSNEAKQVFKDYYRHGELVVTAMAEIDPDTGTAPVQHYGQRLVMSAFRSYFGRETAGALAPELAALYEELRQAYEELPAATTKAARLAALREYEDAHQELCSLVPSRDEFYGSNSTGKLAQYVQWVYVPAVKDMTAEGVETRGSALGKLIRRAVRIHTDLDEKLSQLEEEAVQRYQALLDENRAGLVEIAGALEQRLAQWAHPDVRVELDWLQDARGAVNVQQPVAGVKAGDAAFVTSLSRLGHGLQRSYLLAILQELASSDSPNAPTLLLGCEEPELYQHPPQARYLAEVLQDLAAGNNQVLLTTHSPHFVAGRGFEHVRLVRRQQPGPVVTAVTFDELCRRIREAGGNEPDRPIVGFVAKISQALQPGIAEMLFCQIPVLVEGLEDVAYITTQLLLDGRWDDFRRLGCHLVAANGKDKLIQPVAIAMAMGLPMFLIFDADGHVQNADRRPKHERDNRTLMTLAGIAGDPFPTSIHVGPNHTVWPSELTGAISDELANQGLNAIKNQVRQSYNDEGGLEKNSIFIAEWMHTAAEAGVRSKILSDLVERIIAFADATGPAPIRRPDRPGCRAARGRRAG
jgi:energy-coupling factor transporter ATP-binding protein EcfA2